MLKSYIVMFGIIKVATISTSKTSLTIAITTTAKQIREGQKNLYLENLFLFDKMTVI